MIATSMIVLLAVFGVAGRAASSLSNAAESVGAIGVLHRTAGVRDPGSSRGSSSGIASLHALPSPGYFCATKESEHMVKLVLTQERFDRLIARGWTLDHGPGGTEQGTRSGCPMYEGDDGAD
jgi:hypothetical protein